MTASSVSVPLFSISMAFLHAARPLALEMTTGLLLCAPDDCMNAATLESADRAIQRRLVSVLIGLHLLYTRPETTTRAPGAPWSACAEGCRADHVPTLHRGQYRLPARDCQIGINPGA